MPKSNTAFWEAKFSRNKARDARNHDELVAQGWTVLVVWECALKRDRFEATVSRVVREIELASVGLRPEGRVVEVGYLKPWQHRIAWKRRHGHS